MRLTRIYVRFYKSFNYDYERKFAQKSKPEPWEDLDGAWYPYVRLDLDPSVTTIVGANESGKSHLLDSIEKLITGDGIERGDFCRYSQFFSVEQGQRRSPDFGGEFEVLDESDIDRARKHLNLDLEIGSRFHLFRANGKKPVIYIRGQEGPLTLDAEKPELAAVLPAVFRLDANVPLPASIPLFELAPDARRPAGSRLSRWNVLENVLGRNWKSPEEFGQAAPGFFGLLSDPSDGAQSHVDKQYELGRDLLFRVAQVDPTALQDLSDAIAAEKEGYVSGIVQKINAALATHLNFPRWWAQDREFQLMVSPREYELVFTIRDRTGTEYSFSERSNGLKYFLSYHVQLLAHESPGEDQPEILLMDEPDAYLSSQGQQDLLRILEEFALPEGGTRRDQVAYVTHSPFLINRNAGHRIRVLDKGATDEGTRVVKDVARNHYEPLRSSLGAFVAETSFIGGANLFVEGLADQVMVAGLSTHLQTKGAAKMQTLDLNTVTIVPAGSASSVPYLVYLAVGRDVMRPACVVLLDSDKAGDEAAKTLARGGPRRNELLPSRFIVRIGAWAESQDLSLVANVKVQELEDLISAPVAIAAARSYAIKIVGVTLQEAEELSEEHLAAKLVAEPGSLFDALKAVFEERIGLGAHIEKVGFAKEVVSLLGSSRESASTAGIPAVEQNFGLLLAEVARLMRQATREEDDRRLNNRIKRAVKGFLADHATPTTRERGRLLVEEIQASAGDSDIGDRLKLQTERLRREFGLDEDLNDPIDNFDNFRDRVQALEYEERFAKQDIEPAVDGSPQTQPSGGNEGTVTRREPKTKKAS